MKEIPLTQGQVALIDDDDYEWASQYKWHAQKKNHTFYATSWRKENGKRIIIRLHREIMKEKLKEKLQVDHIDHNGLNNQKSNLRIVTNRENQMNRVDKHLCSSIYPGVVFCKREKKYRVSVRFNEKDKFLGYFYDEIQAAIAYMQAVYGPEWLYE